MLYAGLEGGNGGNSFGVKGTRYNTHSHTHTNPAICPLMEPASLYPSSIFSRDPCPPPSALGALTGGRDQFFVQLVRHDRFGEVSAKQEIQNEETVLGGKQTQLPFPSQLLRKNPEGNSPICVQLISSSTHRETFPTDRCCSCTECQGNKR